MKQSTRLTLPILALVLLLAVNIEAKKAKRQDEALNCSKNVLGQLDRYMAEMEVVPDGKRRFPETIAELKEACRVNKKVLNMLAQLSNRCLSGFTKNVLQVTIYSIKRSQKSLCRAKPSKDMHKFVAAGNCVNSGRNTFRKCLRSTVQNIYSIKLIEPKKRVPLICCEIVRAKGCLMRAAKKVPQCTDENINTIQDRFNHVSMNTMDIACGDYNEDTDKCDHIQPPQTKEKMPNKSLVMTMFDVMESLSDDDIGPVSR